VDVGSSLTSAVSRQLVYNYFKFIMAETAAVKIPGAGKYATAQGASPHY
jgi:hypothetical protein